jgi:hypothetical protein
MSAVGEECARGRPGCRRGMPGTHAHPWARHVANMVSTVTGSSARWQVSELFEEAEHRWVVGRPAFRRETSHGEASAARFVGPIGRRRHRHELGRQLTGRL